MILRLREVNESGEINEEESFTHPYFPSLPSGVLLVPFPISGPWNITDKKLGCFYASHTCRPRSAISLEEKPKTKGKSNDFNSSRKMNASLLYRSLFAIRGAKALFILSCPCIVHSAGICIFSFLSFPFVDLS